MGRCGYPWWAKMCACARLWKVPSKFEERMCLRIYEPTFWKQMVHLFDIQTLCLGWPPQNKFCEFWMTNTSLTKKMNGKHQRLVCAPCIYLCLCYYITWHDLLLLANWVWEPQRIRISTSIFYFVYPLLLMSRDDSPFWKLKLQNLG